MESSPEKLQWIYNYFSSNANDIEIRYKEKYPDSTFTKQTLYNIENGKSKTITNKVADILVEVFPKLNYEYLTRGIGEMIKNKNQNIYENQIVSEPEATYKPIPQKFADKQYKKEVTIIPAKAQLGLQSFLFADEMISQLQTKIITVDSDYKGKYYEIECVGDSMNDETSKSIKEGDFILCREISKMYWKDKFHNWEFVFFHNECGIIVKSIKCQNLETGDLLLESYNLDKDEYPDFTINIKDCYSICNVVQVIQNRKR